MNFVKSEIFNT